jgi:hypothetical protein
VFSSTETLEAGVALANLISLTPPPRTWNWFAYSQPRNVLGLILLSERAVFRTIHLSAFLSRRITSFGWGEQADQRNLIGSANVL